MAVLHSIGAMSAAEVTLEYQIAQHARISHDHIVTDVRGRAAAPIRNRTRIHFRLRRIQQPTTVTHLRTAAAVIPVQIDRADPVRGVAARAERDVGIAGCGGTRLRLACPTAWWLITDTSVRAEHPRGRLRAACLRAAQQGDIAGRAAQRAVEIHPIDRCLPVGGLVVPGEQASILPVQPGATAAFGR